MSDLIELSENAQDRHNFNGATAERHGGDALKAMQTTLAMWSRQAPQNGSYSQLLAIFVNEIGKASTRLATIERLTAEVAALREDAERYRWLRRIDSYNEWNRVGHYAADALDATVDAARTASTVEATTKENDHG